jgi:hypothetical protein
MEKRVLKRGPCRTVSASIVALEHVLTEVELVWRTSDGQGVLQARLDVMQERCFLSKRLAKALVQKQLKHVQLKSNVQEQLKDRVSPEHRQDLVYWKKCQLIC